MSEARVVRFSISRFDKVHGYTLCFRGDDPGLVVYARMHPPEITEMMYAIFMRLGETEVGQRELEMLDV